MSEGRMEPLSPEKQVEIGQALQRAGLQGACPCCGNQERQLADACGAILLTSGSHLDPIKGVETRPFAMMMCLRCGFTSFHALYLLGIELDDVPG